jgi:AcrR family transcriptional regulator
MSKKRQLLIDTALDLFYRYGINSIGINEVLKTSGVAKRTLYSHFESKDALVLAALEQRHQTFMDWLRGEVAEAQSDAELIELTFSALNSWFIDKAPQLGTFRGCFFINTSAEFSDLNSEIFRYCTLHKQQVRALFEQHLSGSNPLLLDALCVMKEGAITTAYMTGNADDTCQKSQRVLLSMLGGQVIDS